MAKKKGGEGYGSMSHGKRAEDNMHMGPIMKGGKGKTSPQTSGHIDPFGMREDAKGMEKGSRGPFKEKGKGKSKAK